MREIDTEPWRWTLYEEGDTLYLESCCSHSFAYYSWTIALNDEETRRYTENGRTYLTSLACEIHSSAPGVNGNASPYAARRVTIAP